MKIRTFTIINGITQKWSNCLRLRKNSLLGAGMQLSSWDLAQPVSQRWRGKQKEFLFLFKHCHISLYCAVSRDLCVLPTPRLSPKHSPIFVLQWVTENSLANKNSHSGLMTCWAFPILKHAKHFIYWSIFNSNTMRAGCFYEEECPATRQTSRATQESAWETSLRLGDSGPALCRYLDGSSVRLPGVPARYYLRHLS